MSNAFFQQANRVLVVTNGLILLSGAILAPIYALFAVQVLVGFTEAFYAPAFDALYSKHVAKTKAAREWAAWESLNYFSIALGAVVGGCIVSLFGFVALFVVMGILSIASAIYVSLTRHEIFY